MSNQQISSDAAQSKRRVILYFFFFHVNKLRHGGSFGLKGNLPNMQAFI